MSDRSWCKNGVGQRPGATTWTCMVSFGQHPARDCTTCKRRYWLEVERPIACGCGGELAPERDRKIVVMRSGYSHKTHAAAERDRLLGLRAAGGLPFEPADLAPRSALTAGEWFVQWIDRKRGLLRPSTVRRYERFLLERAKALHPVRLADVTKADVTALLTAAAKEGLSPTTVSQYRASLSASFLEAVEGDLLPSNPAKVKLPQKKRDANLSFVPWEAVARLQMLAAGTEWELPMALAGLGLRRSEVLGLRWADVDLAARSATVRGTLKITLDGDDLVRGTEVICRASERGRRSLVLEPPKSDDSQREFVLTDAIVRTLKAARAAQAQRRLACGTGWHDHDFVCDRGDGRPLHPDTFSQVTKRLMAEAGLPASTHLHSLRHTSAVRQLEQGVPATAVAAHLGHKDPGFTMRRYGRHVTDAMQDAARAALEAEATTAAP